MNAQQGVAHMHYMMKKHISQAVLLILSLGFGLSIRSAAQDEALRNLRSVHLVVTVPKDSGSVSFQIQNSLEVIPSARSSVGVFLARFCPSLKMTRRDSLVPFRRESARRNGPRGLVGWYMA